MITEGLFSAIAALIFVIGLMLLMYWGVRKLGLVPGYATGDKGKDARLKLLETRMLDPRNRLVLASLDGEEFVVAVGQNGVTEIRGVAAGGNFKSQVDALTEDDLTGE